MPQDSTYVILSNGDTLYLLQKASTDTNEAVLIHPVEQVSTNDDDAGSSVAGWLPFVCIAIAIIVFARAKKDRQEESSAASDRILRTPEDQDADTYRQYNLWLEGYNPYYRKLTVALKRRFLYRLHHFMVGKQFHFVELEPSEKVQVLISSVAVQISFGLDNYEMRFFRDIYVMRTNYHFGLTNLTYEGHVNSIGIYLSWNNFEQSFADYNDGNNVGLHEMAHALAYVNFTARIGEDDHFRNRFKEFSKTARPIFNEMQVGKLNMLGSYAATNYNEFWAVCIENFFERPELLKKELPDLYYELVILLNQDPLSDNLLINNVERA